MCLGPCLVVASPDTTLTSPARQSAARKPHGFPRSLPPNTKLLPVIEGTLSDEIAQKDLTTGVLPSSSL